MEFGDAAGVSSVENLNGTTWLGLFVVIMDVWGTISGGDPVMGPVMGHRCLDLVSMVVIPRNVGLSES